MTEWHMKSGKKPTGGLLTTHRRSDKRKAWMGGRFAETTIAKEETRKIKKGQGKKSKILLQYVKFATLTEPKSNKAVRGEILNVLANAADRQYTRRNVLTKGAIIRVKVGKEEKTARVTSRPGQTGNINAVFEEFKEVEKVKKKKTHKVKKAKKAEKTPKTDDSKKEKKD
ncbi:MAG: 30S ribosomal protein S8e [Candidatus Diapherotrites archaeon]